MEDTHTRPGTADPPEERAVEVCPRCGEPIAALPPIDALALGGVQVRRCLRCGTRSTESPERELVFSCEGCGLPFSTREILPHASQLCPACKDGEPATDLPDPRVVAATEAEVRSALAERWRFVSSPSVAAYLDRVTRQVARRVDGAPEESHVVLADDPTLRTLALPSGTLLVSVGTLAFLEDEAELVFVIGHELAHSASGDAAVRLVRLGFGAVVRGREAPALAAWASAAMDLVRLGYGRKRERDADARALEAMLALEYDPESAVRYLRRLQTAVEAGDPLVAESAVAHPPALDRIRRIERALWGRIHDGRILRVNREVFRRAAGREALAAGLVPTELPVPRGSSGAGPGAGEGDAGTGATRRRRLAWVVAAGVALLALAASLLYLAR